LGDDWQLPPSAYDEPGPNDCPYPPGHSEIPPNTFINLVEKYQDLGKEEYILGRTVVMIKPTASSKPDLYYMSDDYGDRLNAFITAGSDGKNPAHAFVHAWGSKQEARYFEPEEFCMLAVIGETLTSTDGIFTYFNRRKGILVTKFVIGSLGFKDASFSSSPPPKAPRVLDVSKPVAKMARDRFDRLVHQYAETVKPNISRKSNPKPQGSPFDLMRIDKEPPTQVQMRDMCWNLWKDRLRGYGEEKYIEINFKNLKHSIRGGDPDPSINLEIRLKLVGDTREYAFSLRKNNGLDAAIIAGDSDGYKKA